MAERVGFEPTVPLLGSPVFKTGSLNRSDISPNRLDYIIRYPAFCQGQMPECLQICYSFGCALGRLQRKWADKQRIRITRPAPNAIAQAAENHHSSVQSSAPAREAQA